MAFNPLYRTDVNPQNLRFPQYNPLMAGMPSDAYVNSFYGRTVPFASDTTLQDDSQRTALPAWMTDISARGLANDWAPDAHVNPDTIALQRGPLTADTLPGAPAQQQQQPTQPQQLVGPPGPEGGAGEAAAGSPDAPDASGPDAGGAGSNPADAAAAGGQGSEPDASGEAGGGDTSGGEAGGAGGPGDAAGGAGEYAQGGIINRNKLLGGDPPGPDEGYAAVEGGEGVLTKKALKFYGPAIVGRLNKLLVPKSALR